MQQLFVHTYIHMCNAGSGQVERLEPGGGGVVVGEMGRCEYITLGVLFGVGKCGKCPLWE